MKIIRLHLTTEERQVLVLPRKHSILHIESIGGKSVHEPHLAEFICLWVLVDEAELSDEIEVNILLVRDERKFSLTGKVYYDTLVHGKMRYHLFIPNESMTNLRG